MVGQRRKRRFGAKLAMAGAAGLLAVIGTMIAGPSPAQADPEPATVTVVAGRQAIVVTWTAPTDPGPWDHYVATASPGGLSCQTSTLGCTITGLASASYTVAVVACTTSSPGSCGAATTSSAVFPGPPGVPPAPTVAYDGNPNTVTVTWTAPTPSAAIASYRVTPTPATGLTGTCLSPVAGLSCDFTGLVSGTSYTFKVSAIGVTNSQGTTGTSAAGPASAAIIAGPPNAPAKPTATFLSASSVRVTWTEPAGGPAIATYTVSGLHGSTVVPSTGCGTTPTPAPCDFTGLDPTLSYTFTVAANGGAGGGTSAVSPASDPIVPDPPPPNPPPRGAEPLGHSRDM